MTINQHVTTFAGLPVVEADDAKDHPAPESVAWRVSLDYRSEGTFEDVLGGFLATVGAGRVRALVIGQWNEPHEDSAPVGLLAGLADRLANLRALFLGEITAEDCEISWIQQADVTPLLRAWPALEVLQVRGGEGLVLEPGRYESLRELTFQSGGLPADVVRAVGAGDLPALTHLELWLGEEQYGGDATVDDLAGVLSGRGIPALRYLGLRDAEIADEVAAAVASAPVVPRLEVLDLSMGVLSDAGARSLLAGRPLTHLRRLDLSHHYLSEELTARLPGLLPGVEVDVSGRQDEEDDGGRYVAVGE